MGQVRARSRSDVTQFLVPQPREVKYLAEPATLPVRLDCQGVEETQAEFWARFWGETPAVRGAGGRGPTLRVCVGKAEKTLRGQLPAGGYHIRLNDQPLLEADSIAGATAGLQTLAQLGEVFGQRLPGMDIRDWPAATWRGFQVDLARGMSFRPGFFEWLCAELAALKYNILQLYIEHNFAWEAFPEVHEVDALTAAQARQLERTAAKWGITVIPATNVCRHMEGFLLHPRFRHLRELPLSHHAVPGGMLLLAEPESWLLVRTILDEMLDAFSSPFFHLGFDETHYFGKHPASLAKSPARWYADWIRRTAAYVRAHGRRPIIWGDKFLLAEDFPGISNCNGGWPGDIRKAIARVPRDIIIQDWHYESSGDATIRFFRRQGFTVWAAGIISTPHHFIAPVELSTMPAFYANAVNAGAEGVLVTSWGYNPGFRLADRRLSLALAAEAAWRGESPDLAEFERRWSCLRYGFALPVARLAQEVGERLSHGVNALVSEVPKGGLSFGQRVRTALWESADPFAMLDKCTSINEQKLARARRTVTVVRARLHAIAGRARRRSEELRAWGYYLDLYDHLLQRIECFGEAGRLYRALTAKLNPKVYTSGERRAVLRRIRRLLESVYRDALPLVRIQRELCQRDGMPVAGLHRMRDFLRNLAEAIQKVRETEHTGIYPDAPDIFGRWV